MTDAALLTLSTAVVAIAMHNLFSGKILYGAIGLVVALFINYVVLGDTHD